MKTMKNSISLKLMAFFLGVLFILGAGAACTVDPPHGQGSEIVSTTSNNNQVSPTPTPSSDVQCHRSVPRIVLLQDKSDSTNQTRTPQTTMEHVDQLIGIVRLCGGELSFGIINDQSNASLLRLRIEMPPSDAPGRPNERGNPFVVRQEMDRYQAALTVYEGKVRDWRAESERRIAEFKSQISDSLNAPANARATDIFGGIQRAGLFLSENNSSWSAAPTNGYLLCVSDGLDNVRRNYTPLSDNVRFILVNSSNSIGPLSTLRPERFESIESAIRFIHATEQPAVARAAP